MNISGVGEMGVGEMGVGKMGQIIGETGVGEMGVGETGTSRLPPPRGNIHVYYKNIQRSSSLKPLGQSKINFI